jgi:hypothetical protein
VAVILDKQHHIRLRALLIELHMYRVEWVVGENKWELGGPVFRRSCYSEETPTGERIPQMLHETVKLKRPNQVSLETLEEVPGSTYILQFDGGTTKELGVGGYLVWNPGGLLIAAQAIWFGEARTTNNECELGALLEALTWVKLNRL